MFGYTPNRIEGVLQGNNALAVTDVTVIDGTGAEPFRATILIEGGRFVEIGLDVRPAEDVRTVEGSGLFATPGLVDCHVHLTGLKGRDTFRRNIERYPSLKILRAIQDTVRILQSGFTTVRHLGHGDSDQAQAVKEAILGGVVAGPRMQTCGWAMSQTGGHGNLLDWPYDLVEHLTPRSAFVDGPDACRKFVRRQLGDGADCIKVYASEGLITSPDHVLDTPNYTTAELEAIVDEAHTHGARVAAHSTGLAGSLTAVAAGVDTLEHGPHESSDALLSLMLENGTTLVPTLSVFEFAAESGAIFGWPEWVTLRAQQWIPGRRQLVADAADAGIPIAVGSDSGAPPRGGTGASEVAALCAAGLTPLDAIRAATAGGAHAMGLEKTGTISVGNVADMVLWRDDPSLNPGSMTNEGAIELVVQASPGGIS